MVLALKYRQKAAVAVTAQPLAVYPNPVHGDATIGFALREGEQAQQLEVFDLMGKRVSTVPVGDLAQMGQAALRWNAAEALHGQTGLYVVRLTTSMGVRSLRVQCE